MNAITRTLQPRSRQTPFGKKELERLINPKSIVVIGASKNPTSFGSRTLVNIDVDTKVRFMASTRNTTR